MPQKRNDAKEHHGSQGHDEIREDSGISEGDGIQRRDGSGERNIMEVENVGTK